MPRSKKPDMAKIPFELFHSYMVDSRGDAINKSKTGSFKEDNRLHFFCSDLNDPIRTNADAYGQLGNDDSFIVTSIRIGIKLSNRAHLPDFMRATRLVLYIADKPYAPIEANILADSDITHGISFHQEPTDPVEFQVDLWAETRLERQLSIPPRQGFYVSMETYDVFSNRMREIEEGKVKEFAEIKVTLCGTRITHGSVSIEELIKEFGPDEDSITRMDGLLNDSAETLPRDAAPLDIFCEHLTMDLVKTTKGRSNLTIENVKEAMLATMSDLPVYRSKNGEFLISAPTAQEAAKATTEFFVDDPVVGPKKWDPKEYLKTQKKKS